MYAQLNKFTLALLGGLLGTGALAQTAQSANEAQPPVVSPAAPAPECRILSSSEIAVAYARLRARLPSTNFVGARASEICGLARVEMARGSVAYTDATGRFLLLAMALDTHRGSPADTETKLGKALDDRLNVPEHMRQPQPPDPPDVPATETEKAVRATRALLSVPVLPGTQSKAVLMPESASPSEKSAPAKAKTAKKTPVSAIPPKSKAKPVDPSKVTKGQDRQSPPDTSQGLQKPD